MNEPVYERGLGDEGQLPPAAGLKELRELLNRVWKRATTPDNGTSTTELRVQLAIAEMMFQQSVTDSQRRLGEIAGSDFQRDVIPAKYVEAYVRNNGQQALEEGRRQGREDANQNITQAVVKLQLLLNAVGDVVNDEGSAIGAATRAELRKMTGSAQDDLAIAKLARIERAAYERGYERAEEKYHTTTEQDAAKVDRLTREMGEVRTALGMDPSEDHTEVVNEIGLYRGQLEAAEAKLKGIETAIAPYNEGHGAARAVKQVLES